MSAVEIMKNFNATSKHYFAEKTEEGASNLQKYLQVLSATSDGSVFDPGNREAVEFFSNLYELMLTLDTKSTITWTAVNVLLEASRNSSTRELLNHTFKFSLIVSRLLEIKLITEKKLKVLQLLQELTYNIEISWHEAHLPYFISTLTKWITGEEPDLIPLSLGILVNLCYKNLPAIYTLMRSVDVRKFLKTLLKIQKDNVAAKVQVCKLLIILEGVSGSGVPDLEMETYIKSTCPTLANAIQVSDAYLMRHIVKFFKEIANKQRAKKVVIGYRNYAEDIEKLLKVVKGDENINDECIAALFDYLCCAISLEVPGLESLFPHFLELALRWVHVNGVSTIALNLISMIITSLSNGQTNENMTSEKAAITECVFDLLYQQISVILLFLDFGGDNTLGGNEAHSRLTALIQLLSQLLRIPKFSCKVGEAISSSLFRKLFDPLMNTDFNENNLFQESIYTFYIEALCFLTDLADKETSWLLLYNELLQERQVQLILSIALYTGSENIKNKVLTLTGTTGFSTECLSLLANRMSELNKLMVFSPTNLATPAEPASSSSSTLNLSPIDMIPLLTITQEGHLNGILDKCEQAINRSDNSMTSSVMELYQYKMASMSQRLRQMQWSQEAADQRAARLQHNLAMTGTEISRLHQLLHNTQQALEVATKDRTVIVAQLAAVREEAQLTHSKYSQALQNLRSKTVIITDQANEIERLQSDLKDRESQIHCLEGQYSFKVKECADLNNDLMEAKEKITGFKKSVSTLEVLIDNGKKEIESKNSKIESLKKEILDQSGVINKLEKSSLEKDAQISEMTKELNEQRRMREIISELAMGKRKLDKQ